MPTMGIPPIEPEGRWFPVLGGPLDGENRPYKGKAIIRCISATMTKHGTRSYQDIPYRLVGVISDPNPKRFAWVHDSMNCDDIGVAEIVYRAADCGVPG